MRFVLHRQLSIPRGVLKWFPSPSSAPSVPLTCRYMSPLNTSTRDSSGPLQPRVPAQMEVSAYCHLRLRATFSFCTVRFFYSMYKNRNQSFATTRVFRTTDCYSTNKSARSHLTFISSMECPEKKLPSPTKHCRWGYALLGL